MEHTAVIKGTGCPTPALCAHICWHILWVTLPTVGTERAQCPDGTRAWREAGDWSYRNTQCLHVFLCFLLFCKLLLWFCLIVLAETFFFSPSWNTFFNQQDLNEQLCKFDNIFKCSPLFSGAKTDLGKYSLRAILDFTREAQKIETHCSMPDKNLSKSKLRCLFLRQL